MVNQISPEFHYYLEDLKCIYYGCHGLSYGKEGQTLFIDNESSKAIQNSKWSGVFFLNHLRDKCCQKKKVQWLDSAFRLWPPLVGLPLAKTIQVHYDLW